MTNLLSELPSVTASKLTLCCASLIMMSAAMAQESVDTDDEVATAPDSIPDVRGEELKLKLEERNWFIVPIPASNPTTDTGLVLGGAYFYPQTETEKEVQPPSVTGAAGYYSSNDSAAFGVAHQSYWRDNKWRFGGIVGHVDLNLKLSAPGVGLATSIDWFVEGEFIAAIVSRKIAGKWYAGVFGRYLDIQQEFGIDTASARFNTSADTVSGGVGIKLEHDTRDKPFNSQAGSIFELSALVNSGDLGSDNSYNSYSASYRSYHSVSTSVVLAWEVQGCHKTGEAPLWDACQIDLRGFPATDYLGRSSASGQAEARWQFHPKWGVVAFAGNGYYKNSFSEFRERELIPSYGIGLRFMVLKSQRINMRLDYGRSKDSDAIYLSVGEAF